MSVRGRTLLEEVLSVIDMKFSLFYFTTENHKKGKDKNTENTQMQCGEEAQKETIRLIDIGFPQSSYSSELVIVH